jgi:hypothetical protein
MKSNVDTSKLGTYTITYSLTSPETGVIFTAERTVHVIDTVKPVIRLRGPQPVIICIHSSYTDSGYEVTDNYWKNSTGISVIVITNMRNTDTCGLFTLRYVATDGSGNFSSSEYRLINIEHSAFWCESEEACPYAAIEPAKKLNIKIYPNPTTGKIWFKNDLNNEKLRISISDLAGRKVMETDQYTGIQSLDLSYLTNGLYLIKIQDKESTEVFKIEIRK